MTTLRALTVEENEPISGFRRRMLLVIGVSLFYQSAWAELHTGECIASYGLSQSGTYRLDENSVENLQGTLGLEYFHDGSVRWNSWYTNVAFTAARHLTADQQLLIGGENGFRGYPSDYQQGNRRALWVQRMLHLDFTFPLDGDDSIDQVQVLLRGRTRF